MNYRDKNRIKAWQWRRQQVTSGDEPTSFDGTSKHEHVGEHSATHQSPPKYSHMGGRPKTGGGLASRKKKLGKSAACVRPARAWIGKLEKGGRLRVTGASRGMCRISKCHRRMGTSVERSKRDVEESGVRKRSVQFWLLEEKKDGNTLSNNNNSIDRCYRHLKLVGYPFGKKRKDKYHGAED